MLLDPEENLYCISAWNDNGKDGQIEQNPHLLHRTDFFGGLGWMLKKSIWTDEWSQQWPEVSLKSPKNPKKILDFRPFGMIGSVVMNEEKIENVSDQKFRELRHSEKSAFRMGNFSTSI